MNEICDVPTEACLVRGASSPQGVRGSMRVGDWCAWSQERPWVDNLRGVSCVPVGRYLARWLWSPKHERLLYHLIDVPNRDEIEMHPANVFEQLLGCIALGRAVQRFAAGSLPGGLPSWDMFGVTDSVATMAEFEALFRDAQGVQRDFYLTIK